MRRLADVKIKMDEGTDDLKKASKQAAEAADKAFYYYQTAGTLWKSTIELSSPDGMPHLRNMTTVYINCPHLMRLKGASDLEIREGLVKAAWACPDMHLAEAERQIR